jgi:hypothetical protein
MSIIDIERGDSSENIQIMNSDFPEYDVIDNSKSTFLDSIDFQNNYIRSNSPLTMSGNNSDNSDSDENQEIRNIRNDRIKNQIENYSNKTNIFKKKEYKDVEKSLSKYYDYNNKYSSKLDILITYMRGQKNVFMYSKYITQDKISFLVISILILSSSMAIFSPIIQHYEWSGDLICGLNIIVTAFVTILNIMKYESNAEKFLQLNSHYDKIEMSLEITNSKLLFIDDEEKKNELVLTNLNEIEIKMDEIKSIYHIIIPEEIINLFPIICNVNVFSLIKKMETHNKKLIHKFKDVKNEIRFILYKWRKEHLRQEIDIEYQKEKSRLLFLYDVKEKLKQELSETTCVYDYIDDIFTKEIKNAELKKGLFHLFFHRYTRTVLKKEYIKNPVILKYFQFIFEEEL